MNAITPAMAATHAVLALILLFAGWMKLADRHAARTAEAAALGDLLPSAYRVTIWRAIAFAEIAAAALALVPARATAVLVCLVCVTATAYALWAWRFRPRRPCGCFGAASHRPADLNSAARSGLLLALAVAASASVGPWWDQASAPIFWLTTGLLIVLVGVLSPEVRALRVQRRSRCLSGYAAARRVARALPASAEWRRLASAIYSRDPHATWRSPCIAFVAFRAQVAGRSGLAVFAVALGASDDAVRGALVDDAGDVLEHEGGVQHWPDPRPRTAPSSHVHVS